MTLPEVPDILCAATRRVLGIDEVNLLGMWEWCVEDKLWTIQCKISINIPENSPVPSTTNWYIRVSNLYPDGTIHFFPAKKDGIIGLFPHQYPIHVCESKPWQNSFLCLNRSLHTLDRVGASTEPRDWRVRLKWTFERAVKWLERAANNDLIREGERFELPFHQPEPRARCINTVIVSESYDHLSFWGNAPQCGVVDLSIISKNTCIVQSFCNSDNSIIREMQWGTWLTACSSTSVKGLWIQIDKLPVIDPWQQPKDWGELRTCIPNTKINNLIKKTILLIPNERAIILLVGSPIPEVKGGQPNLLHWQALLLPAFMKHYKGYRSGGDSRWNAYHIRHLGDSKSLPWLKVENWHQSALATRGQLPKMLREMKIVILGVGALGAPLAEHLIRGGVTDLTLIDGDHLVAGNLVRHSLTMNELEGNKAEKLMDRLNSINPHTHVRAIAKNFSPEAQVPDEIRKADLIIDATGSDDVTAHLNSLDWEQPKHFVSVSIGLGARSFYAFYGHAIRFPVDDFNDSLASYLGEEHDQFSDDDVQWEGTGCFHPVFEARSDDLGLWSSLATKLIIQFVKNEDISTDFAVLKQSDELQVPQVLHRRYSSQITTKDD